MAEETGSAFPYKPSNVAPAIFAAYVQTLQQNAAFDSSLLFTFSGLLHLYQTLKYRSWRTTGPMPWAAFLLTVGFILREINAFNTDNIPLYIAEAVLIMSGPPVYAGINYLVLSRVLFYVPYLSPLHPGRVLTTFLAADALCEILIINGVQKIVDSRFDEKTREIGNALTKSGLILQVIMFGLFVLLAAVFHTRARKRGVCTKNIRTVLIILYISCTIITARCIYRIVEFFEYGSGPLHDSEAYFWVFEATIMFINTAMLNVWHPGKYLPRSNKVFLSMDGKTEIRGPGYKETRPFIATLLDPFDITGLITGRDAKTKFWDWTPEELERIDQENEQKKLEKDRLPRATWKKVLDPLHMFDHKGRIVRFAKTLEKPTDRQEVAKSYKGTSEVDARDAKLAEKSEVMV